MSKKITAELPGILINSSYIREAFNRIKVNIDFTAVDKQIKSIQVTSSIASEGKSIVSANIALAMAAAGRNTLLIDCDMRWPQLHAFFQVANYQGLSDIIVNQSDGKALISDVGIANLSLLTSGRVPPNPAELLGSQRMSSLLDELKQCYDYIILDSPPLLPIPDAVALSRNVDGVVFVVRHGITNQKMLQRAKASLELANATLLGAIINDVPAKEQNQDGYGYGYGYGYHSDREKQKAGMHNINTAVDIGISKRRRAARGRKTLSQRCKS